MGVDLSGQTPQLLTDELESAAEHLATLRGQILLHRAFLAPGAAEDEQIRLSLKQQLRYVWGHYRTHATASRELRMVLSAEEPELAILKKTATTYGRDLILDWQTGRPHLDITDPYTLRAIGVGRTRKDDPALIIDYEARFKVGVCSLEQTVSATAGQPTTLTVPLPRDPWLFFWHVPAAARRPMRYAGVVNITNPCSDDDFAELPHPYYYWYDWQPGRKGPDANGQPFDCPALLRPGVDFFPNTVQLRPYSTASRSFRALREAEGVVVDGGGLAEEQRVELGLAALVRGAGPRVLDEGDALRALVGREQGQLAEGARGPVDHRLEQGAQVAEHPRDGRVVEAGALVADLHHQRAAEDAGHGERVGRLLVAPGVAHAEALGRAAERGIDRVVLEEEEALEEGRPPRDRAQPLQLGEGAVLVLALLGLPVLQRLQPGEHRRVARDAHAHRQGVERHAHERRVAHLVGGEVIRKVELDTLETAGGGSLEALEEGPVEKQEGQVGRKAQHRKTHKKSVRRKANPGVAPSKPLFAGQIGPVVGLSCAT